MAYTPPASSIDSDRRRVAIRDAGQADLYFYSRYTFANRKGFQWKHNWHHRKICDALMSVYEGRVKRLIINMPPRYSKTEMAVLNFISWCFGHCPDSEFIHTSYSSTLAENNSANTQAIMAHESYADIFPDVHLAGIAKAHWKTTAGGVMYATGSGGSVTGFGAGKLRDGFAGAVVIDDPHKSNEAGSDTMRKSVIDWYQNTLSSRCNNPDTPIILIMQRLHENDLAGWLADGGTGEEWTVLNIPAIGLDGLPLWPWKHDIETLNRMAYASPYVFAGQYMQRPAPLGGGLFKTAWWRYYDAYGSGVKFKRIVQSWDTAFKDGQQNDFSVCTTWGDCAGDDRNPPGYYMMDLWRGKLEYPELRRMVGVLAEKWKPQALLVEDKASGQSLIQSLRRETRYPVIAIQKNRGDDKISCAHVVTPLIEGGQVFLPLGHPETAVLVHSASQFPNGMHDDDVDSMTQALRYLTRGAQVARVAIGGF